MPVWSPGKTYPLQNDFSCMVSADMYEKFFLQDVYDAAGWLDHAIYHLDGPGAVKHLDLLLDVPKLRAIQWTPGDGQPPMPSWIPMLQRIQNAGKGLFLYVSAEHIEELMKALRPQGVIYYTWATDEAHADQVVRLVEKLSAR